MPRGAPDPDELVVLLHAPSRFAADTIVALLEAHGLHAFAAHRPLEDVFPSLFSHEGTAVQVRAADVREARQVLEATSSEATGAIGAAEADAPDEQGGSASS